MVISPKHRKRINKRTEDHRERKPKEQGRLPEPQPKQREFLECPADIVFVGGAAGGGKSFGLLLDAAREENLAVKGYNCVIFRRTRPDITNEGGIWDESSNLFPGIGGVSNQSRLSWEFGNGTSRVRFSHLQYDKDKYRWKSAQVAKIGFEEVTEFEEDQFWYLLSRNRNACGVKPTVRATTNPDADSWVADLIAWWIGEDGYIIPERSGVIRYFFRFKGDIHWGDTREEIYEQFKGEIDPILEKLREATKDYSIGIESIIKSFTFISADIYDNPELLKANPEYLANLNAQHPVEMERLLRGNWKIRFEAGLIFDRTWFGFVDEPPLDMQVIRFWDLAATAKEVNQHAYYTAGLKVGKSGNDYYILDAIAQQVKPGAVEKLLLHTATMDGTKVKVRWELEGGSSGKLVETSLKETLEKYDAEAVRPYGDKVTRAIPVGTRAYEGHVYLVRASWNDMVLNALQSFDGKPRPLTNDITDSLSGAYDCLSKFIEYVSGGLGITRKR